MFEFVGLVALVAAVYFKRVWVMEQVQKVIDKVFKSSK